MKGPISRIPSLCLTVTGYYPASPKRKEPMPICPQPCSQNLHADRYTAPGRDSHLGQGSCPPPPSQRPVNLHQRVFTTCQSRHLARRTAKNLVNVTAAAEDQAMNAVAHRHGCQSGPIAQSRTQAGSDSVRRSLCSRRKQRSCLNWRRRPVPARSGISQRDLRPQ